MIVEQRSLALLVLGERIQRQVLHRQLCLIVDHWLLDSTLGSSINSHRDPLWRRRRHIEGPSPWWGRSDIWMHPSSVASSMRGFKVSFDCYRAKLRSLSRSLERMGRRCISHNEWRWFGSHLLGRVGRVLTRAESFHLRCFVVGRCYMRRRCAGTALTSWSIYAYGRCSQGIECHGRRSLRVIYCGDEAFSQENSQRTFALEEAILLWRNGIV